MPVASSAPRKPPSIRPTVGKFWTPAIPHPANSPRNLAISRNGSVPHTPATTGILSTTVTISLVISSTIRLASP